MDAAGLRTAHVAGNSLGGFVALQLAARGRAESVVALAPAGGWAKEDQSWRAALEYFADMHEGSRRRPRTPRRSWPRRRAAPRHELVVTNFEHIPRELLAHHISAPRLRRRAGDDRQRAARGLPSSTRRGSPARSASCGGRGPAAAVAVGRRALPRRWLPHADWVELDGIGHCPQLDVPLEAAQLILGLTAR